MCECGPVFRQLAIICRYVKCESVQLFRYSKEAEDMHVMLPDRKKACQERVLGAGLNESGAGLLFKHDFC